MKFKRDPLEQGFTLLELLVVLVIIGLLAGIVGPRLFKNVNKSDVAIAKVGGYKVLRIHKHMKIIR